MEKGYIEPFSTANVTLIEVLEKIHEAWRFDGEFDHYYPWKIALGTIRRHYRTHVVKVGVRWD